MTDTDLPHKILSLLKRGPYMRPEIHRYCRPHDPDDVDLALRRLESNGTIRHQPGVGLYDLVPQDFSTGATPHD